MASSDMEVQVPQERAKLKPAQIPRYTAMVEDAVKKLTILNKRGHGSSRQAIQKYIKANYSVSENANSKVTVAIKKCIEKERLVHTKGKGAVGSYKLSQVVKNEVKEVDKKRKKLEKKAAKKAAKEKENNPPSSGDSEHGEAVEKKAKKTSKKAATKASSDEEKKKPKAKKSRKETAGTEKPKKARATKKDKSEGSTTKASKTKAKKPAAKEAGNSKKPTKKVPLKSKTRESISSLSAKSRKMAKAQPRPKQVKVL